MKRILFILLSMYLSLPAAERPPQKPSQETYLSRLQPEIFIEVTRFLEESSTLGKALSDIEKYYAIHPESKKSVQITRAFLGDLMQKFNVTTGKELQEIIDRLKKIPSMTVFENPDMKKWIGEQKKRLFYENELREAAASLDVKKVKELIKKGVNVNTRSQQGNTALIILARGLTDEDKKRIADVNEIASSLIHAGANVNAQTQYGITALNFASAKGFVELVEMLLKNKANPNLKSLHHGITPLHEILGVLFLVHPDRRQDYKKIARLLLEAGADANSEDKTGRPLKHAIINGISRPPITEEEKEEILNLLRQYGLKE